MKSWTLLCITHKSKDASKTNSSVAIAIINCNQSLLYKLAVHNSIYAAKYFKLLERVLPNYSIARFDQ